jgi:hypothetical protein
MVVHTNIVYTTIFIIFSHMHVRNHVIWEIIKLKGIEIIFK